MSEVVLTTVSSQCTTHPFAAVGNPIVPVLAVPPDPTLTVKAAVPLLLTMKGVVPKPDTIVGAVVFKRRFVVVMAGVVIPVINVGLVARTWAPDPVEACGLISSKSEDPS
jgi:hypothetical protein